MPRQALPSWWLCILLSWRPHNLALTCAYEQDKSGVPVVQSCANRLHWHCGQALYCQLHAWCALHLRFRPFCRLQPQGTGEAAKPAVRFRYASWYAQCSLLRRELPLLRMVHGLLIQGHEEFFICRSTTPGQDAGQESVAEMLGAADPQEWHHGFQVWP